MRHQEIIRFAVIQPPCYEPSLSNNTRRWENFITLSLQAQDTTGRGHECKCADITELGKLRLQIDSLDNELIHTLSERMKVCLAIGEYKKRHHVAVVQKDANR